MCVVSTGSEWNQCWLIQRGDGGQSLPKKNEFKSCPFADCSSFSVSDLHMRDMYKLRRSRSREQQHNRSLTDTPSHLLCTPPSLGHSQRSCSLPSGMWMCIMEMDGGWLCHTVEQTDSSLNACLPASISLPPTAPPRNRAQAQYRPAQVCVNVCACTLLKGWLQKHVINIFCVEKSTRDIVENDSSFFRERCQEFAGCVWLDFFSFLSADFL